MPEVGLGEFDDQEVLKKTLEAFEKNKKGIQDHIIERTAVVPDVTLAEIEKEFNISTELAKAIFVLEFEYHIPRKLSANCYKAEMKRLTDAQYELPDIYSFRVRYSMEEGFWIKYLVVDLPKKIEQKMGKLKHIYCSLFGDIAGDKEDAAVYIIERAFICSEIIKPIIHSWMKDHPRATYSDCVKTFLCKIQRKASEKCLPLVQEIGNRFHSQMESLRSILTEIRPQGWIMNAKEEYNKLSEKLMKYEKESYLDWRLTAEIILETMLLRNFDDKAMEESDFVVKEIPKQKENIVTQMITTKKEKYITDDISAILTKLIELPDKDQKPLINEMIQENYDYATVKNREKPAIFSKIFLERIMTELSIRPNEITKITKKFDVQLMFRLSPTGGKEFPNLGIDDKITGLLEEFVVDILKRQNELKIISSDATSKENVELSLEESEKLSEEIRPIKKKIMVSKIKESSEKELWLFIRDEYLKELFDSEKELIAGAKILKKYSLELGLLMTEGEAISYLTSELEKKGFSIDNSSTEDIDSNVCKIIFKQLKELRKY
ncbi:MAG: hypothetical protein ACTSQK_04330 [Candidatus Heimdallarchaeota archaeon]